MTTPKRYRASLGFTSQAKLKAHLGAKDIVPIIDETYLTGLTDRIKAMLRSINGTIHEDVQAPDIESFIERYVDTPVRTLLKGGHIHRLRNQGRRKEQVVFNWLRGHVFAHYLKPSVQLIFETAGDQISDIGDDDYSSPETFSRTAKADLAIPFGDAQLRIEAQSGFQGINDIKRHKFVEARRHFEETGEHSVVFHGCFFSGRVAIIPISALDLDTIEWVARAQMEGQLVTPIDDDWYCWSMLEAPPAARDIETLRPLF